MPQHDFATNEREIVFWECVPLATPPQALFALCRPSCFWGSPNCFQECGASLLLCSTFGPEIILVQEDYWLHAEPTRSHLTLSDELFMQISLAKYPPSLCKLHTKGDDWIWWGPQQPNTPSSSFPSPFPFQSTPLPTFRTTLRCKGEAWGLLP